MSKRSSSPTVRPTKLIIKDEPDCVDLTWSPVEQPTCRNAFQPPAAGPKTSVLQSYVLEQHPRVEVTISLHGMEPRVRFASIDTTFIMPGVELLQLAELSDIWPTRMVFLDCTQIYGTCNGGCQLTHDSGGRYGRDVFDLTEDGVTQFKSKLGAMVTHIRRLQANKAFIRTMFDSIVKVFKVEYERLGVKDPIDVCMDELCLQVMCHVPPYTIVRDFCHSTFDCQLNHYSLLSHALAQKGTILLLLKKLCNQES